MTDNAALLQSIQTINDITMKANNSCDQDCMMERQKSDLKKAYLDAERNVKTAPEKFTEAEHNYLLNKDGPKKYTELLVERYGKNADLEIQKLKDEHDMIMKEVLGNIKIENHQQVQIVNSTIYNDMLVSTKDRVQDETTTAEQDAAVSNRKIFYMEKRTQSLSWWYYLVRNLYWICTIVWLLVYVLYYRQFNTRSIIIFVLIFAYPFFMVWLFVQAHSLYKYILSFIPRDIYLNF
jgi:hypothetical protein